LFVGMYVGESFSTSHHVDAQATTLGSRQETFMAGIEKKTKTAVKTGQGDESGQKRKGT
jgi:hypothetical protein